MIYAKSLFRAFLSCICLLAVWGCSSTSVTDNEATSRIPVQSSQSDQGAASFSATDPGKASAASRKTLNPIDVAKGNSNHSTIKASVSLLQNTDRQSAIVIQTLDRQSNTNSFPLRYADEYIHLINLFLDKTAGTDKNVLLGKPHVDVAIDRAHVYAHYPQDLLSINQACWFDKCDTRQKIFYPRAAAKRLKQLLTYYTRDHNTAASKLPEINDPAFARVYVYRVGSHPKTKDYPVFVNDKKLARLGNKTYFWANVEPGKLKVEIKSDSWGESNNMLKEINVEANKNYFLKFTPNALGDQASPDSLPRDLYINMNIHIDHDQLKLEHQPIALNDLSGLRQLQVIQ